jgi:hypothetical protein
MFDYKGWDDINSLQNNFSDEIYGFALDREVVRNITKFNEQELSELFDLLDCSDSEVYDSPLSPFLLDVESEMLGRQSRIVR